MKMYRNEKLQAHFDRLTAQAAVSLDEYAHTGRFEAVHHFRVQVKKMRAMLRVYTNRSAKKQLAVLKNIFRAAGVVRVAGIHLDLLRRLGADKTFLLEQYKEYNSLAARFRQDAENSQKQFLASCHALRNNFEDIKNGEIIWRFLERTDRIGELLGMPETLEIRHQARMVIKDVIYAYPLSNTAIMDKLGLNIPYLDALQEKIGSWHDTVVFTDWLMKHEVMDPQFLEKLNGQERRQKAEMNRALAGFDRMALLFP